MSLKEASTSTGGNPNWATVPVMPAIQKYGATVKVQALSGGSSGGNSGKAASAAKAVPASSIAGTARNGVNILSMHVTPLCNGRLR